MSACPRLFFQGAVLLSAAALVAGCGGGSPPMQPQTAGLSASRNVLVPDATSSQPLAGRLYTVTAVNHKISFWPINTSGAKHPTAVSAAVGSAPSIASDGSTLYLADEYGQGLVAFDTATLTLKKRPDPFGSPIGVTVDPNHDVFVLNAAKPNDTVTEYPAGGAAPVELSCNYLYLDTAIVADNEGDVFVQGFGRKAWAGVIEIPNSAQGLNPQACSRLNLRKEPGGSAGITVDPKTDALVTLDNPDQCAGGVEGRVTIYPKPYIYSHYRTIETNSVCAVGLKFNSDSSILFVGDQDASASYTYIRQFSYPAGHRLGSYWGGSPGPFAIVPGTLPN